MDPMLSNPEIVVHESDNNNEIDDTSSDSQDRFLQARTKIRPISSKPEESDQPIDWERFVESSSHDCLHSDKLKDPGDQISTICAHLFKIFRDREKYKKFLSYQDKVAQDLLDLLQKLLDHDSLPEERYRVIFCVALVRLCRKSGFYPRCFSLTDVRDQSGPISGGGSADIYKAQYNGRVVCVKVLRLYQISNRSDVETACAREAVVWGQLSHPNILPFYGIHRLNDFSQNLSLVSPWMSHGNIRVFLARMDTNQSQSRLDRTPLIVDVASGMNYLHENGVVHGDLKSWNILVTEFGRACLADFGLSSVSESSASGLGGHSLSSGQARGGTACFKAPELFQDSEIESRRTNASDVFAFSMVCFEIFTGKIPFNNPSDVKIAMSISRGNRPQRPDSPVHVQRGLTDAIWALMQRSWSPSKEDRPTAAQILQELPHVEAASWEGMRLPRPGFEMSNGLTDATIARALPHLQLLL